MKPCEIERQKAVARRERRDQGLPERIEDPGTQAAVLARMGLVS